MTRLLLILLAAPHASGCSPQTCSTGEEDCYDVDLGRYLAFPPSTGPSADGYKLLVYFHGYGSSASKTANKRWLRSGASERGYLRKPGECNVQRVTVKGPWITVELNGSRILHADTSAVTEFMGDPAKFKGRTRPSGFFGLAGHSDPVKFRDLWIRGL